ncbi:acyltransferase [Bradyrhizobium sp. WD16]|nr:acyltransferase family protein [Bradyrhizobium sp. WD16]UTD26522.1 acyltransferase [Bradyrhizobium sp. WD16]
MLSRNETPARRRDTAVAAAAGRLDWVDYAKGICIVMVVTMHSTLGVEAAAGRDGFMHLVVAFAKPFRMPDFFLISGLFLARVIGRDWRTYLDRKVVHFAYFYLLWVTIQFAVKAPAMAGEIGWARLGGTYLQSFIEPFGTLWFIYLLPVFFVVARLVRPLPAVAVWAAAAALEMLHVSTGWTVIDEFAARFVYFYSGYLFATEVFALSSAARRRPGLALAGLGIWALADAAMVGAGLSDWPLISLLLGFAGAGAVVVIGTLLARADLLDAVRYCGEHSIVIYLAFFLPMAATRTVLLGSGLVGDIGLVSLIVTAAGVLGALALWRAARSTPLNALFERPDRFHIAPRRCPLALRPAD